MTGEFYSIRGLSRLSEVALFWVYTIVTTAVR